MVPGLLLLLARELALHDPVRVLAWRLGHDPRLAEAAQPLAWLLPRASGALDRDPLAQALAACAVLFALGYAVLAAAQVRTRIRAVVLGLAAALLVVGPSLGLVAMGALTERPYGQDGGVVQLPLAIDRILAGQSPYGADYSGTMLARQARASSFWDEWGGNPILRHHAYLPGTHLLVAPFQISCRAAFGFFDPRLVTLLFYGLAAWLASRIPRETPARLAAAGVAALNPLTYWHQLFGANDVVFVALLLGVVLLARAERRVAAAMLLGLACATKQLAWPFAPFLLLSMSGVHGLRDLITLPPWRRLAAPGLALAAVFVAVVAPVAALDFRAFWADIVVYNVGLPGGDNYPLGGTPGFGFANFLIYFGRVGSLRDHVPFSAFYLLLVPLGLLLLRSQLREGRAEWALATGSTALVASLYFSRVVHPNYLIPAAMLLPLAVLGLRRSADLALAPLLLLAVAVEISENAVLRTAWEQAAAADLPRRLGGWIATLAPRCPPQLSADPWGLLASALIAGCGVVVLAGGVLGAGPRLRASLLGVAALVVALPTVLLVTVSDRTGLVRAQHPAVVQARADAERIGSLRSPYAQPLETTPRGREQVSSSFRLDPPREIGPDRPLLPPGPSLLALAGRVAGVGDLRLWLLAAAGLLGLSMLLPGARPRWPTALAVALLLPPLALGAAAGSPFALWLAVLAAAWRASRSGRSLLAGALVGLATAFDHGALWVAVPILLDRRRSAPAGGVAAASSARSALLAVLAGGSVYLLLVGPVALLDPRAFLARLFEPMTPGSGLGLFDLFAYRGLESSPVAVGLAAGSSLLVAAIALSATARAGIARLPAAAVIALVWLVLAPSVSADAVAVPLVLLALAAQDETTAS